MSTDVHQTLGKKRIEAICLEYGLMGDDQKTVDEILEKLEPMLGKRQTDKMTQVIMEYIKGKPHHTQIIEAMIAINTEFAIKRMKSGRID